MLLIRKKNWRPHITIDLYNCDNKDLFDISLSKFRLEKRKNRIYRPHITLCTNDDLNSAIKISEDMFKHFVGKVAYLWIYNPQVNLIKEYSLDES